MIREYKCDNCSREIFEKYVHMFEEVYCRNCGRQLKPLLSKSSFILKGGGWGCSGYSKNKGGSKNADF